MYMYMYVVHTDFTNRNFPSRILNLCRHGRKNPESKNLHFCNIKECGSIFARIQGGNFSMLPTVLLSTIMICFIMKNVLLYT